MKNNPPCRPLARFERRVVARTNQSQPASPLSTVAYGNHRCGARAAIVTRNAVGILHGHPVDAVVADLN
jgi:hypothetical protein